MVRIVKAVGALVGIGLLSVGCGGVGPSEMGSGVNESMATEASAVETGPAFAALLEPLWQLH